MRDDPDGEGRIEPEGKIGELLLPPKQLASTSLHFPLSLMGSSLARESAADM